MYIHDVIGEIRKSMHDLARTLLSHHDLMVALAREVEGLTGRALPYCVSCDAKVSRETSKEGEGNGASTDNRPPCA